MFHWPRIDGYLLAALDQERLAAPLAKWLRGRRITIVKLRTDQPKENYPVDKHFRVIPNEEIDPIIRACLDTCNLQLLQS
jgi:hypothetical protein